MDNDCTAVFTIRMNIDDMMSLLARVMGRPVQAPSEAAQAAIDRVTQTVGAATAELVLEPAELVHAVEAGGPNVRSGEPETGTPVPAEKPAAGRRARAAATAPAAPSAPPPPPPAPLTEFELRALLSKVGQSHPNGVKGVIDLLQLHGGARRLSECGEAKWPAIEAAARAALDQYGKRGAAV
jgi:hypothetical protein